MSQQFGKDVTMDGVRGRGENIFLGALFGIVAAALGAGIWMGIETMLNLKPGLVAIAIGAIAIGAMVGFAVRLGGNGTGMIFGIMGALLTLAGCLGGELLAIAYQSVSPDRDFFVTLTSLNYPETITNIFTNMSPISYLIYGIGLFEGYKFSIRH